MSAKILRLVDHVPEPKTPIITCTCGSTWFRPYGVVFEEDGNITGWSGPVHCVECDAPLPFFDGAA